MACRAVGGSISAPIIRFMIGTHWVVGANPQAVQSAIEDVCKSRGRRDKAPESALRAGARCIDKYPTAVDLAAASHTGQRVDSFLQRTGRVAAIESDFCHQCVRYTVKKYVGGSGIRWCLPSETLLPVSVSSQQLLIARGRGLILKPFGNRGGIKMDENAFPKLLDCGQPVRIT